MSKSEIVSITHQRMEQAGILEGSLDSRTRAGWPDWARAHFQQCNKCRALLIAEQALLQAGRAVSRLMADTSPLRPPSMASLYERLARRHAPPVASLVGRMSPLPNFRSSPLELSRTTRGLRGWHPNARSLSVFAVHEANDPVLLKNVESRDPGVGFYLDYLPTQTTRVVAVATSEPMDWSFWSLWLGDHIRNGTLESAIRDSAPPQAHFAVLQIPRGFKPVHFKLQRDPLPEPLPEITAILRQAAMAGRHDNLSEAVSLYRKALDLSVSQADSTGRLKATAGIALALARLGYYSDVEQILEELIEDTTFDSTWGEWLCRLMASNALYTHDLETASFWLEQSHKTGLGTSEWARLLELQLALAQDSNVVIEDRPDDLGDDDPISSPRIFIEYLGICHLALQAKSQARLDKLIQATTRLGELPNSDCPDLVFFGALCDAAITGATGNPQEWPRITEQVCTVLTERGDNFLSTTDAYYLTQLSRMALEQGQMADAKRLFAMRFGLLDHRSMANRHLLGMAAAANGLLIMGPTAQDPIRRISLGVSQLKRQIQQARQELQSDGPWDAVRMLGTILFPEGRVPWGEILVGSDGILADAPLFAIAMASLGDKQGTPVIRELVGLRSVPSTTTRYLSENIVSLADAQGNLPSASAEVRPEEASLYLRGNAVVRSALHNLGPVGLLHLAVHTRRERGIPELLMADGPISPVELAGLKLEGSPVVLLSACTTGLGTTHKGFERSLAQALLQAGASSIIATRWPVVDHEMYTFVRSVIELWPFQAVPEVVAHVCRQLKQKGHPPRLWAAPVVY